MTQALHAPDAADATPDHKLSLRLWLRLLSCSALLEKTVRARLTAEFDTTLPRFDVLSALDRAENGLTMGELSNWLLVSNGNVTGVVARLLADGLVERRADPNDRRVLHVSMTPLGKQQFGLWVTAHEHWIDELLGGLTSAYVELLIRELGKIKRVLP